MGVRSEEHIPIDNAMVSNNTGQQKNNFFSKREKGQSFLGNSGVLILNLALVFF